MMPIFEIETPDGKTYQVDAVDITAASRALQQITQQAPEAQMTPLQKLRAMPEDQRKAYVADYSQRMNEDAVMEQTGGLASGAASFLQGVPFIGEYFDEAAGAVAPMFSDNTPEQVTEATRLMQSGMERKYPKTSLGLKVAGGVTGSIPALAALTSMPGMVPASMLGRVGVGVPLGATLGGAEGAVSGYGSGTDDQSRADNAQSRGLLGTALGGAVGGAAPLIGEGIKNVSRSLLDHMTIAGRAKQAGLSKPSYDILTRSMDADGSLNGPGAQRIAAGGPGAMLADSGPAAQAVLDTAIQKGNKAARVAKDAVDQRATQADAVIDASLNRTLGRPQGTRTIARNIAQSSSAARQQAYDAAYSSPINYADPAGKAIEDVLQRIPDGTLAAAVKKANNAMKAEGARNKQIMATLAPDGSVTFREMPNVQQLDYIKRALGEYSSEAVDQFGRKTGEGNRAGDLAKMLRDAIGNAVPGYRQAVALGGDKIAEDNALALGNKLFNPSTTREDVAKATASMSVAERTRLASGLRMYVDDLLANVKMSLADTNMDAREAVKAVREFSSRANREKLEMAIGPQNARQLLKTLDEQTQALTLRAAVAQNSKTFPRLTMDQTIKQMNEPGFWASLGQGKIAEAPKRLMSKITNQSPDDLQAREDRVYEELARALTGPRGKQAQSLLGTLQHIATRDPKNAAIANQIGGLLGYGAFGPAAYQTGMQLLGTPGSGPR